MTTPRVYTPQTLAVDSRIELEAFASHHINRVLRLKAKAGLLVFNGDGSEYQATITTIQKTHVTVTLGQRLMPRRESNLDITLGQGISRGERMDYTLQKSVELGINRITPIWTQRTQVKLDGQRLEKRLERWRGIIRSACEQSGRLVLPRLDKPVTLKDWCKSADNNGNQLLLDPEARQQLGDVQPIGNKFILLIGPEGGLDAGEIATAIENGFTGVGLGPRILRTETAAIAALSALQVLWGDLG